MANFIPKLGLHANLPAVREGSFLITTDEREIYVDTAQGRKIISNGKQEIEYIVGTQSAATNVWTGVSKDNELYTGKIIAYQLPHEGTGSAATLTLTLATGTTTEAIPLRRQGIGTVTKHYPANSIIILIYDGTYWRTDGDYNSEPVSSVNGKTGHVQLSTSDLANDSGYITMEDIEDLTAGSLSHTLTIGSYVFDGSADVVVPVYGGAITNTVTYVDGDSLAYGGN